MQKTVIFLLLLIVPIVGMAQFRDQPSNSPSLDSYLRSPEHSLGFPSNVGTLLDPSRMHWSHSFSTAYATSSDGSVLQGAFTSTMIYELSRPITLMFRLGYLNEPYNTYRPAGMENQGQLFGGFGLQYRPTRNTVFQFEFQQIPASSITYQSPYSNSVYPWRYTR